MARIPDHLQIKRDIPRVSGAISTAGSGSGAYIAQGLQGAATAYEQVKKEEADIMHEGELAEANSRWLIAESKRKKEAEDNPDYNQAGETYRAIDTDTLEIGEIITRPDLRERFINEKLGRIEVGNAQVNTYVNGRRRDADAADISAQIDELQTIATESADPSKRQAANIAVDSLLKAGVKRRSLTALGAERIRQSFNDYSEASSLESFAIDHVDKAIDAGQTYEQFNSSLKGMSAKNRVAAENRWARQNSLKDAGEAEQEREKIKSQKESYENMAQSILQGGATWGSFTPEQQMSVSSAQQMNLSKYSDIRHSSPSARKTTDFTVGNNIQVLLGNGRFEEAQEMIHRNIGLLKEADKFKWNQAAIDGLTDESKAKQIESLYTPFSYVKSQLGDMTKDKNKKINLMVASEMDVFWTNYQDTHKDKDGNPQEPTQEEWKAHANKLITEAKTDVDRAIWDSPPTAEEFKGTTEAILSKMTTSEQAETRLNIEQQSVGSIERINTIRAGKDLPPMSDYEIERLKDRLMQDHLKPKEIPLKGELLGGGFTSKLKSVESGGDYDVVNNLGYTGAYQFGKSTAKPYLDKLGKTWGDFVSTPVVQDKVFEMSMDANKKRIIAKGYKPTELNMWIAHNQGVGGMSQILKGKISADVKKGIANNLPEGGKPTPSNYIAQWSKKFSDKELV